MGDESLAIYGLKGYAYTYSPEPSNGFHLQAGVMYSKFEDKIEGRDGDIWAVPFGFTYGNGDVWEFAVAAHWEKWENTNFDVSEKGFGDIFIGIKYRLMGSRTTTDMDLSLMPYVLIPTGNHDKSIGDLYLYNPSDDEDFSYGINLLIGKQWDKVYLTGNVGINFVNTDLDYIDSNTLFVGLALEYRMSQDSTIYLEFMNNENKNKLECGECFGGDVNDDMRELGAGITWKKDEWGFKLHGGFGFTDTSPNYRILGLINRRF